MSPFSEVLRELRLRFGLRQVEMAELLSCEQTYISALEVSSKGPPPPDFINKLITVFNLSPEDQETLQAALEASNRRLVIDRDAPTSLYYLLAELRQNVSSLHPVQINMMREMVSLKDELQLQFPLMAGHWRRRTNSRADDSTDGE